MLDSLSCDFVFPYDNALHVLVCLQSHAQLFTKVVAKRVFGEIHGLESQFGDVGDFRAS